MTTDCGDVANGALVFAVIAAIGGFLLGWFMKKGEMLEEWRAEQKKEPKS